MAERAEAISAAAAGARNDPGTAKRTGRKAPVATAAPATGALAGGATSTDGTVRGHTD